MTQNTSFSSTFGSNIYAVLRLLCFMAMIVWFVPIQIVYVLFKPHDIFKYSLIFHQLLIKLLCMKIRVHGVQSTSSPTFFVCNHTSYLDVSVLGSLIPASFVAKAELAGWPIFGYLSKLQNTVFIERRTSRIGDQSKQLQNLLSQRRNLILFPEGTSTDGLQVLPFKSGFFSIISDYNYDIAITVQPVSISCSELGGLPLLRAWRPIYAWFGDMTFVPHLWQVFKIGHFTVDVIFHPPVEPSSFTDRKALAGYCQQQVTHGNEACLKGPTLIDKPKQGSLKVTA